jgi:glycerophosphoryl diester phosphodiesterase
MFAFRRALQIGANALEMDLHASSDRRLIVCHDETVDRTSDGSGEIASRTLEELRLLDNAYWFVPGEDAVRDHPDDAYTMRGRAPGDDTLVLATLDEVLEAFPGVIINIDIKRTDPVVEGYEELIAAALAEAGRTDDVIVTSFHDSALEKFKTLAAEVSTAAGPTDTALFTRAARNGDEIPDSVLRHVALQVPTAFYNTQIVDQRFVDVAHEHGLAVHVWTIDDPLEMAHLVDLGVDGVMTDKPSILTEVLESAGKTWQP